MTIGNRKNVNWEVYYAHMDVQNAYKKCIKTIKDTEEKNIIHCLFQDLSDKLMDNIEREEK
jgi:hypothetical protein